MQHVIKEAVRKSGLTRRELSRRAGLSASTISRIERGEVDPSLGTVQRILAAAGLQLPVQPQPLSAPGAIRAARSILNESDLREEDLQWAETLKRWSSPDGEPNPRGLAIEAGRAARPALRPGKIRIRTHWNLLRVFSAVAATREGWAVSGAAAAERIGARQADGPTVIYVERPIIIAGIVEAERSGAQDIILLPFDGASEAGAWNDDGIVWADPIQIILDCYGMDETAAQADELTAWWGERGPDVR